MVDVDRFQHEGWLRIPSAVPEDLCERLVEALVRELNVPLDDPTRWPEYGKPMRDLIPMWGHQSQWDIRQHPNLQRIYASLWGSEALTVTTDCCRFSPPWRPGYAEPLDLHWDHLPTADGVRFIQGVIALTDTAADQGGWRSVPSLYRTPDQWTKETIIDEDGDECWPADTEGHEVIHAATKAGDLIVWDSHLPHANSKNLASEPRLAFYVSMNTAARQEDSVREATIESWRTGTCVPWWRDRPGFGRVEPWPPAQLTTLGRRLLGIDPWPETPTNE